MASFRDNLTQGLFFPKRFLGGRIKKADKTVDELTNGEGAIVDIRGEKTAVYKSSDGELTTLSPVCKHLGCLVEWNQKDTTWDCPCHGSRYSADGTLVKGPAKSNLDKVTPSA